MNQEEEEDYPSDWDAATELPEATVGSCLLDIATFGLALLSMGWGLIITLLAIDGLVERQPDTLAQTLNVAALPHSLRLLLGGFACQVLVAFGLFTFQLHRQVRAVVPGMALLAFVAAMLLLIGLTA